MKTIQELYESLDFQSEYEYFNYFIETHVNWQFSQLKEMLRDIKSTDSLENLINHIKDSGEYFDVIEWISKNS